MSGPSKRQRAAKRTGQVKLAGDHYKVRIRFADGTRHWIALPTGLTEEQAKERATRLAKKAFDEGWTENTTIDATTGSPVLDLSTVPAWFDAYLEHKQQRRQAIGAPSSHVRNWIIPHLGSKRMDAVTPDDLRALVGILDEAILNEEIRWKTAANIWGTVTKAFKDAANSKNNRLRLLKANPALGIPPPDKGCETEKVHLFPSEFSALMNCGEVPLIRRRAYAIATYMYLRPGELEALDWQDIDLAHEQVTICRSVNREQGGYKSPKNGYARAPMTVEPALMPLLITMHRERGGRGLVVERGKALDAETLRADLLKAGVTRHELHHGADDPPREWMTLHDLRTTGITWMAVRGDDLLVMKTRAGHSDVKMTEHYIHVASVLNKARYGQPFPALPACLTGEPPPPVTAKVSPAAPATPASPAMPVTNVARTWSKLLN